MARIIRPRELQEDGHGTGLWHMTVASDEERWPAYAIGACAAPDHPGHKTPEEAAFCYDKWCAEGATTYTESAAKERCGMCGIWTQNRAQLQGEIQEVYAICRLCVAKGFVLNVHMNRRLGLKGFPAIAVADDEGPSTPETDAREAAARAAREAWPDDAAAIRATEGA
jgi:hypothetical protein